MATHIKGLLATILMAVILVFSAGLPTTAQSVYSDAKIEAFAAAVVAVADTGDQWLARVQAAPTPEAARSLEQQAMAEVAAIVEAIPGITFAEYKAINTAAQNDAALNQRIQQALEE